jgi:UDP-N-acetylmuramoylalanine--D-glutamate ligase
LLYHILKTNDIPCLLAGNIGIPVFDIISDIKPETVVILELSCHQLEYCNYSPSLSLLLNIFEDHLDHYGSMTNYIRAKKNIYLHQHPLDVLFCNEDLRPSKLESVSRTIIVNRDGLPFDNMESINDVKLKGQHNLNNCAFVYYVSKSFGITDSEFIESLKSFEPLPHRLERIGSKNGVEYYDDSISTTVESAISAVKSIRNVSLFYWAVWTEALIIHR